VAAALLLCLLLLLLLLLLLQLLCCRLQAMMRRWSVVNQVNLNALMSMEHTHKFGVVTTSLRRET